MADVLQKIVSHKVGEVAAAKAAVPLTDLQRRAADAPAPRNFLEALEAHAPVALIAEIKKASPSAGLIRPDFDPCAIARDYGAAGAACLSVLTDEKFFQGSLRNLELVRGVVDLPLLRKDFLIDPYQVWEARAAGADAILLIAECLTDTQLRELFELATQMGMTSLIELYDPENLPRVLALRPPLVGINNRDLRSFVTDLDHTVRMRRQIPADVLVVGESGIHSREDVLRLQAAGVGAILVGESLMRSPDIQQATRSLLGN